jgi:uncharacterized protein YbcI
VASEEQGPAARGGLDELTGAERTGERGERGQLLACVSDAVVAIHKQFYGKGPTKARSHLAGDLLVVLLEGGFTRAEHTLSDRGYSREVQQTRLAMQSSVEDEFCAAVESILGRSVRSFMSANDPRNELQAEIFVLFQPGAGGQAAGDDPQLGRVAELADRARRARDQHRELLSEHRALRSEQEQSRKAVDRERERPH